MSETTVKRAPSIVKSVFLASLFNAAKRELTLEQFSGELYDEHGIDAATDGNTTREAYVNTTRQALQNIRTDVRNTFLNGVDTEDENAVKAAKDKANAYLDANLPKLKDSRGGGNHRGESAVDLLNALVAAADSEDESDTE